MSNARMPYKHTVSSYDAAFPYTLVYSLNTWQFTKKVLINKH